MDRITNTRGYAIGEMSRRTGVKVETIRYYERIALMPEPGRTAGGNRQYDHDQLKRLTFIRRGRELGFGIGDIRALLGMADQDGASCAEVQALTAGHLVSVRDKIASLRKLEAVLSDMAAECDRGDMPDCPILDTMFEVGAG